MSSPWYPRLPGCNRGSKLRLAFGKLYGPWWSRKNSKATLILWFVHRIVWNQSSPLIRTQPTVDRSILRCNTLMLSNWTFVNAKVCKVKSMAGVTTALKILNRNSTCLFVSKVKCLLNLAQALDTRCCSSARPRCFRFPGMRLPRYLCKLSPWRTCTQSCDTSANTVWCSGFVVNILLCFALRLPESNWNTRTTIPLLHIFVTFCNPTCCSSHESNSKSKLASPKAFPLGHKQTKTDAVLANDRLWLQKRPGTTHFSVPKRMLYCILIRNFT